MKWGEGRCDFFDSKHLVEFVHIWIEVFLFLLLITAISATAATLATTTTTGASASAILESSSPSAPAFTTAFAVGWVESPVLSVVSFLPLTTRFLSAAALFRQILQEI